MKYDPIVSVVMPLYNKRPYVKRAIESVRQQTFTRWELIIIDDGSTDGSSSEIPKHDQRIRLFQQANTGPSAARNHGIRMAQGEFVAFLDADDCYRPQKLEVEMELLKKNNMAQWMISAGEHESEKGVKQFSIRDIDGEQIDGPPKVFDNAFTQLSISGWPVDGFCIKKQLLERLGGFRESMRYLEITDLQIRCALEQPRVIVFSSPLYRVVDVPESASKISSHRLEALRQMGEALSELANDYPEYSNILASKARKQLLSYVSSMIRSGENAAARRYLARKYPYSHDTKWRKLYVLSCLPNSVLKRYLSIRTSTDAN